MKLIYNTGYLFYAATGLQDIDKFFDKNLGLDMMYEHVDDLEECDRIGKLVEDMDIRKDKMLVKL